jgi:hypothetical protein
MIVEESESESQESVSEDEELLHTYSTQKFESNTRDKWVIDATVNNTSVQFRIDTGAKTSILTSALIVPFQAVNCRNQAKNAELIH